MSNSQGNRPSQPPHLPPHEHALETLALAEWLAELRAAGDAPQLSELIAALPDAVGDLADATMLDALVAEVESADLRAGGIDIEDVSDEATPPALSAGAQRAVTDIIGAGNADALAMVAETSAPYAYEAPIEAGVDAAVGLLALAHRQGLDAEELAAQIMLSSAVLRWLDRVALPLDHQQDALVFHLVGALGVPRERVQEALTHGTTAMDPAIDTDTLANVLTTSASLTPAQRAYWAAQLAGQE